MNKKLFDAAFADMCGFDSKTFDQDHLQEYVDANLLKYQSRYDIKLYCYTQDCFFGKDTWDDVTKHHRGALYYQGFPVNRPFPKIFNIGEVQETSEENVALMMANEYHEVLDKANGHLFIASMFPDEHGCPKVVFHTKGSIENPNNDLLSSDIDRFASNLEYRLKELFPNAPYMTVMLEAIVEHDKHTMYESQCEVYGENTLVLLGYYMKDIGHDAKWCAPSDYDDLVMMAELLETQVVKPRNGKTGSPIEWLEDTGVEGYVIWFPDLDRRVKIKTKEYWTLRFKNDLSADRIVRMFRAGGHDRIHLKLPEELANDILTVVEGVFTNWYRNDVIDISGIYSIIGENIDRHDLTLNERCKNIMARSDLSTEQKTFLVNTLRGKSVRIFQSKNLRKRFYSDFDSNEALRLTLQNELESIVNRI